MERVGNDLYNLLLKQIKNSQYEELNKAIRLDDIEILELLEILVSMKSATKKAVVKLVDCFHSDEIFLFMMLHYQACFYNTNVFNRLTLIKDDSLKIEYIKKYENPFLKILLILSLNNSILRKKLLVHYDEQTLKEIALKATNAEVTLRLLPYIHSFSNQIKCSDHVMELLLEEKDSLNIDEILALPSFDQKIQSIYENLAINGILFHIIKETRSLSTKRKILEHFYNLQKMDIFDKGYQKNFVIPSYEDPLPKELLFGVEIECIGDNSRPISAYSNKILNYKIESDSTIADGLEFVSPKLSWQEKDLNSIYQICEFATSNKLEVDSRCGGHIHFSLNYLNSYFALFCLFYLFTKFENILYVTVNQEGESPREKVLYYASPFSKIFTENISKLVQCTTLQEFISEVQKLFKKRPSLALSTFSTIEFRMPNSSLEPEIIIENILLLGNLIVLAKKMSILPLTKDFYELFQRLETTENEKETLEIFLHLLFKDENNRTIFRRRYHKNRLLPHQNQAPLKENIKTFKLSDQKIFL